LVEAPGSAFTNSMLTFDEGIDRRRKTLIEEGPRLSLVFADMKGDSVLYHTDLFGVRL